jgi:hypothetical protein
MRYANVIIIVRMPDAGLPHSAGVVRPSPGGSVVRPATAARS